MCKKQTKKINERIKKRSDKYYNDHKETCAKHNFYKRCEVFIKKRKPIWPPLKREEIREYISVTKMPGKFWKNKKLW
jgi:hypothetical protein